MKRDMDLVRLILFELEGRELSDVSGVHIDGFSDDQVRYHVRLMHEAGLISQCTENRRDIMASGLTWEGHEFIDASRNDTFWRKVKDRVIDTAGGLSWEVLKAALVKTAIKKLDLD